MATPTELNGTCMARPGRLDLNVTRSPTPCGCLLVCAYTVGAGEGNRTLMTSLEGWGSAIELRPRIPVERVSGTGRASTAYRFHGIGAEPGADDWAGRCLGLDLQRLGFDLAGMTVAVHAT